MLLGLRGTGKTVLLSEIGRIAEAEGLLVSKVEAPEETNLANLLYPEMRKVSRSLSGIEAAKHFASRALGGLRNFASVFNIEVAGVNVGVEPKPEPGLAESGDIQHDLPDLFGQIGRAAQAANKGWVLLIDSCAISFAKRSIRPDRRSSSPVPGWVAHCLRWGTIAPGGASCRRREILRRTALQLSCRRRTR